MEHHIIFSSGVILNDKQRTLIGATCIEMLKKIKNYERRIKGNNTFIITTLVSPQLRLDSITSTDHETLLTNIH